jgi:NADH-quinone oxidoreductase subunit A
VPLLAPPPLATYLGLAAMVAAVLVLLTGKLSPRQPNPAKSRPYASGVSEPMSNQTRWPVLFFYPWAVILRELSWGGLLAVSSFFVVLGVGYVYARERGALEWR